MNRAQNMLSQNMAFNGGMTEDASLMSMTEARFRLSLLIGLFAFGFVLLAGKIMYLAVADTDYRIARADEVKAPVQAAMIEANIPAISVSRADVVDRNGVILATSLVSSSLSVDPRKVREPDLVARRLAEILPHRSEAYFLQRLTASNRFQWLERHLTPRQKLAVNALGEPALEFHRSEERIYPHGRLASHVLGRVNADGEGIMGVESYFNERLADPGRAADPLKLSLDVRVQYALADELSTAMRAHKALGAAGVVMDVRTGELVGMVSLPDFDPNVSSASDDKSQFNRASMGAYELGSVFKAFTMAAALDEGVVTFNDKYDAIKPIRFAGHTIRDDHPKKRVLTVPEVFTFSSNIGTSKIALDLGQEKQEDFLRRIGFLSRPSLELPEVTSGLAPRQWHDIETMTISYGHGLSASPVQLVQGIAAMVNGGRLLPVTVVRKSGDQAVGEQVINWGTSQKVRQLMRLVVQKGTGRNADAVGYRVGGKTGTAEIATGRGYARNRLRTSFVGAFPMDDPQYVVFAMLEEPKGTARTHYFASAGWTAAPIVKNVVNRIAPLLNVAPAKEDQGLYERVALLIDDKR